MAEASVVIHNAWQKIFDRFDRDKSGLLDMNEIKEGLKVLLGTEVPPSMFETAMAKFDKDDSGRLDIQEFGNLIEHINESRKAYTEEAAFCNEGSILGKDKKLPFQDAVNRVYHNKVVATFVAFCIIGNFFINILEKQIDPNTDDLSYGDFWATADVVLNIIFFIELMANMYAYGGPVKQFWASGWNVFDTIIVAVGVLTMVNVLGPPLDKLKLMRAFRVFRLFKRVQSLNKIIVALLKSVPGVINAFIVMLVFFCIYAILAVELFRDFGDKGNYEVYDDTTGEVYMINTTSARGYDLGIEYYGTFMRALYTLFQVMTGESWSEAVARPLLFGLYRDAYVVGIFFVSFIILTQIVLINVVVAVLLEKFVASEPEDDIDEDVAVDARLSQMDNQEVARKMNGKIDQIVDNFSKLDSLSNSVTELNTAVADLRAQILTMREERGERFNCEGGAGRRHPSKHPWKKDDAN